jgi:hypothetical protein
MQLLRVWEWTVTGRADRRSLGMFLSLPMLIDIAILLSLDRSPPVAPSQWVTDCLREEPEQHIRKSGPQSQVRPRLAFA